MKQISILFILLFSTYSIAQQNPLKILWETTVYNGYDVIKLSQTGTANLTFVKENDPNVIGERNLNGSGFTYIIMPSAGKYILSFFPINNFRLWTNNFYLSQDDLDKILEVQQWGNGPWSENIEQMFENATNLKITAIDVPNLQGVKRVSNMFRNCTSIETITNINLWDTSTIEYMDGMFHGAENFNGDISSWNVNKVYSFAYMFFNAKKFNQNLGNWNLNMGRLPGFFWAFSNSGLSCENYTKTLQGFTRFTPLNNPNMGAHQIKYGAEGNAFRNILLQKGWTFTGDVFDQNCVVNLSSDNIVLEKYKFIYPNPTSGELFIKSDKKQIVKVFDQSGKKVLEKNLENGENKIYLNAPNGLYFLMMDSKKIKILKK